MLRRIRTRNAGSRAGYIWAVVEPLGWIVLLKMALSSHSQQPPLGTSYEVFFATGVVLARTWRTSTIAIITQVARPRRLGVPMLHRLDATYAIWLLEMTTGGIVMLLVLVGLGLFGFDVVPANPLVCLMAYGAVALFAIAFALIIGLVAAVAPGVMHFQSLLLIMVFYSSGFSLLTDRVPPEMRTVLVWNPLLHCIEWFREGFYAGYECHSLSLSYFFTVTITLLLIGLTGERAFRRRVMTGRRIDAIDDARAD